LRIGYHNTTHRSQKSQHSQKSGMDSTFILKIILTPSLIGLVSWAGRKWGPAVSGWLVGLPLTSGPITLFLALGLGAPFARSAAQGTLQGTISQALVCLTYAWLAQRWVWPFSLAASIAVFAGATWLLQAIELPLALLYPLVLLVLLLIHAAMPAQQRTTAAPIAPPPWDIPARMLVVTAYVIILTGSAAWIGPHLTGLLSPFPLYGLVLATLGQHFGGSGAALRVMHGLVVGLFAFASFFGVIASTITIMPLWLSFALAVVTVLLIQALALWMMRQGWV
jgi:hypothetical protein